MIVKKNPIDAKVKSLQDQLAAVSFATSAVSDSILASFSSLTCATSVRSDLISFPSRSFWACAAASWFSTSANTDSFLPHAPLARHFRSRRFSASLLV